MTFKNGFNMDFLGPLGSKFRRKVGYMPQQQALYDNFTARRFMMYISALKGISTAVAREQTEYLLSEVELHDVMDKAIGGFSGGMKQRVLVAQSLLGSPELVLLDEPTAGLDPKQRVIIRDMIHKTAKDKIVLVSTHIVSDVETIADEIIIMKQGRIAASGRLLRPSILLVPLNLSSFSDEIIIMKQGRIAANGTVEQLVSVLPHERRTLENAYMLHFPEKNTAGGAIDENSSV